MLYLFYQCLFSLVNEIGTVPIGVEGLELWSCTSPFLEPRMETCLA